MNLIALAFSKLENPRQLRIIVRVLATTWLVLLSYQISSVTVGQETDSELLNPSLTPNPAQSSLPPIDNGESLLKHPKDTVRHVQESLDESGHKSEIEAIRQIRKQLETDVQGGLFSDPEEADRQFAEELTKLFHQYQDQPREPTDRLLPQPRQIPDYQLRPLAPGRWEQGDEWTLQPRANLPLRPQASVPSSQNPANWPVAPLPDRRLNPTHVNVPLLEPLTTEPHHTTRPRTNQFNNSNELAPKLAPNQNRSRIRVANPFSLQPLPSKPGLRVKVNAVRAVATQLEQAAAELENLQLYEDADTVRAAANGVWRRARSIEKEEPQPSETVNINRDEDRLVLER